MFCCALLCVHSSIAIILMGKRELVALLDLSSWCLVMDERLFLAGLSAVCYCGISWSYSLTIFENIALKSKKTVKSSGTWNCSKLDTKPLPNQLFPNSGCSMII